VLTGLLDDLDPQLPLRVVALLDRFPEVAPQEIRVFARDLLRLVPGDRVHPEDRFPVELDESRGPRLVDEAEGVHPEAFHHSKTAREGAVGHDPEDHVHRLGHERNEIPEGVVRGSRLRHLVVGLRFHGMDQIGELDRVLDEKDRHVVPDQIEDPLFRVELDGEPADVASQVGRAPRARDCREPDEHRGPHARVLKKSGPGVSRKFSYAWK
jgi:hypothetical protein